MKNPFAGKQRRMTRFTDQATAVTQRQMQHDLSLLSVSSAHSSQPPVLRGIPPPWDPPASSWLSLGLGCISARWGWPQTQHQGTDPNRKTRDRALKGVKSRKYIFKNYMYIYTDMNQLFELVEVLSSLTLTKPISRAGNSCSGQGLSSLCFTPGAAAFLGKHRREKADEPSATDLSSDQ